MNDPDMNIVDFSPASSGLGCSGLLVVESLGSSGALLFLMLLNIFLYCHLSILLWGNYRFNG